jgi:nucleoside phosphorylase
VANINVIKGLERWVHKLSLRQPDVSLDDDQFYGDNNIMERARGILHRRFNGDEVRRTPIYRIGAIGGDGFLIRDASVPIAWRSFARDLILFEMELPGVFAACNRPFRQYPLIVVRSISDIVGFQRSIEWTDYACSTAAVFFIEMIKSHPSMEKRS